MSKLKKPYSNIEFGGQSSKTKHEHANFKVKIQIFLGRV